jgi:hypothetical protein
MLDECFIVDNEKYIHPHLKISFFEVLPPPAGDIATAFLLIFWKLNIKILTSTIKGMFIVPRWRGSDLRIT